ncbi:hypothetical protein HUJ04_009546 [Dendroctonus ponderosae]|uniref:MD-2-related lipid-recognition domain-containing protein n=3 Tax=Dendroctonus ponderosae TaxID=77166 RepID=A0AAR5PYH9_DENPD|nr:hypothetical protein HUJ04_009545 [Dendroctonus ponderosae]KAH1019771.1 hypothetical protein HUJ04_009546 [Dendroctonus ponderosae]
MAPIQACWAQLKTHFQRGFYQKIMQIRAEPLIYKTPFFAKSSSLPAKQHTMNLVWVLPFLCYLRFSCACNGYSIKLVKYQNCVDDSIIKLPAKDFTVILDKECNVYGSGCVEITKDFTTANGKYQAKKAPLPLIEGEINLCELSDLLKNTPNLAEGLDVMGIPTKCPVKARKICSGTENKFSLLKYKNQIGMAAGNSEFKIEIEHDTGRSCIEIHASISKARKG